MFVSYSQQLRRNFPWIKRDRGTRDQVLDLALFFDRKRRARRLADHAPVRIIMRSWATMETFKVQLMSFALQGDTSTLLIPLI
jgi:hypothetical protein